MVIGALGARAGEAGISGQVSGCESGFAGELVDGCLVAAAGCLEGSGFWVGELGQAGAQEPVVGAGEEQGVVESGVVTW
jgi:hypothetical protein